MKNALMKLIYFLAEKGKLIGINRDKLKALLYPAYRFFRYVIYTIGGYLYLYHVEMPITQRCNLRCKHCIFMMPYFKHPVDYPVNTLLQDMDKLFDAVDAIQIFRLLGGETFLYKDLDPLIEKALSSPKVKTVEVVSNGTIIPPESTIELMKNPRLIFQISHYGKYSRRAEEIKAICDKAGVKCVVRYPQDKTWNYVGDLHFRGRTEKELRRQLRHCASIYRNFLDGRLYFCPRASFGSKLGMPDDPNDFVDVRNETDRKTLRRKIFELNQSKYIAACNYCDEGTGMVQSVPVAEQL